MLTALLRLQNQDLVLVSGESATNSRTLIETLEAV